MMKSRWTRWRWLIVLLLGVGTWWGVGWWLEPKPENSWLKELPSFRWITGPSYKVDEFIAAAAKLQVQGKDKAANILRTVSLEHPNRDETIFILCRMLFTAKSSGKFQRPSLGSALFISAKDNSPLEPIEIVDGIPFLIVQGYSLGGKGKPASSYVDYCLRECDWSTLEYKQRTTAEKKTALEKLVASRETTRPLHSSEKRFLTEQIE